MAIAAAVLPAWTETYGEVVETLKKQFSVQQRYSPRAVDHQAFPLQLRDVPDARKLVTLRKHFYSIPAFQASPAW